MKDRYDNQLEIGDTVLVACLSGKSAHLREAIVKDFATSYGTEYAKVRTEAGGSTRVKSGSIVKVVHTSANESFVQKAA